MPEVLRKWGDFACAQQAKEITAMQVYSYANAF
jgi:hypothetical protein